ncbi:hypothetical protein TWF191_000927 [Orbilia oligospora]|uniref:Vacuolar protein sorting-associated protein 74 n=2 Tax=Orbilia oligospora TaxID=2813651 RepID=A0A7C8UBA3_ORBOL|nr:hypothetical protein TWF679_001228 [Orbilia oligospora]KAF3207922.1 hypothetical protein TWF191_000927 [Orbilia oligospora]
MSSSVVRRRGAGGGAGASSTPNANGDGGEGSSTRTPIPASGEGTSATSYTSEDGGKVVFDPRDISESKERSKQPKLTLMEEVLLLGLKDKQGYLSFWNDNISYALRGCIVIELAFRGRIAMQKDASRRRFPLADRLIEVVDDALTGEVLLDEALKMMKSSEKMSVSSWIDLMSGETWNLMKIGYQLKQVRERLAKGLVDKGILRTEKRNFLLFDMATHPVADGGAKTEIRLRAKTMLTARTIVLPPTEFLPEDMEFRYLRTVAMVCAAYAANVLENALSTLGYDARERAFAYVEELLALFSQWPFGRPTNTSGSVGQNLGQITLEEVNSNKDKELQLEVVAACLSVIDIRRRLKRCIINPDLLVLKRLIQSHPNSLNFCDPTDHGNTPLHLAASRGQTSIVTFLVQAGHEKDGVSRNFDGQTPLMVASGSNDENADDVVFYLVGEFENCVEWRDKSGMTALSVAAKAGNDASINILLDAGADINAVDPLGNTPLHYASAYGHLKAMRTLMDRGANFDVRNREGWYPKDYSYSKAAETYFKTLIDGVTIKNVNTMGQYTPTASNPFAGLMGPGGISSSVRTAGNFIPSGGFGMGGMGGAQTAPSSRDGSKRPSTAGSFSYGSHSIMGGSTATLVPSNTGGGGGIPMLPSFAPAMGQLGSTVTLIPNSGTATPMDYDLPPPPSRVLKSAASMVEFSRMDRGSMTARPGTPQSTYSSNMGEREFSSPLAGRGGGEREGRADGGRHSATGSVSSYASVGSVGSMHGGGLPVLMQGQQMQQIGQGQQQGSGQQQQRALYEAFTKLRPRASSNG